MRKGRFNKQAAEVAQRYSESVSFDWELYPYDIAGSMHMPQLFPSRNLNGKRSTMACARSRPRSNPALTLFDIDVANVFDVRRSLTAPTAIDAPAPGNVSAQIARWHKLLD